MRSTGDRQRLPIHELSGRFGRRMADRTTFADLGIPFPLFTAPVAEAERYHGVATCGVCKAENVRCFRVYDDEANELLACYECVRTDKTNFGVYTELGSIRGPGCLDAIGIDEGAILAHGFEVLPHPLEPNESDWHLVHVPEAITLELARTPEFKTWQGCIWLFCCSQPMVYRGAWKEAEFEEHAGDKPPGVFFDGVVEDVDAKDMSWPPYAPLEECGGPYVFQCKKCRRYRGYHDMS